MNKTRHHTADVHSSRHRLDKLFEVNTTINKMSFNVYVLSVSPNLQWQTLVISSQHHVIFKF